MFLSWQPNVLQTLEIVLSKYVIFCSKAKILRSSFKYSFMMCYDVSFHTSTSPFRRRVRFSEWSWKWLGFGGPQEKIVDLQDWTEEWISLEKLPVYMHSIEIMYLFCVSMPNITTTAFKWRTRNDAFSWNVFSTQNSPKVVWETKECLMSCLVYTVYVKSVRVSCSRAPNGAKWVSKNWTAETSSKTT